MNEAERVWKRGDRLDLYLAVARAEALALCDPGAPYARVIARSDVSPRATLTVCRHQAETAKKLGSLAGLGKTSAQASRISQVALVASAARDTALAFVRKNARAVDKVNPAADLGRLHDFICGVPSAVYVAHIVAESAYLADEGAIVSEFSGLPLADAVVTLRRYGSLDHAMAAADFALMSGGEWLPTPDQIRLVRPSTINGMLKEYPTTYGGHA